MALLIKKTCDFKNSYTFCSENYKIGIPNLLVKQYKPLKMTKISSKYLTSKISCRIASKINYILPLSSLMATLIQDLS